MEKAMNTVEILELICTFLPTRKILSLQLVSKKWRLLIHDSPQLSRRFFVEPRWTFPSTKFKLLHLAIPGLEIKRGKPVHLGQWIEVRMNLDAARKIWPAAKRSPERENEYLLWGFSSDFRCRRSAVRVVSPVLPMRPDPANLLVTQPPLKGMQCFLVDAHRATFETASPEDHQTTVPAAHWKISCDAGITLGFLAEVAQTIFDKHSRAGPGQQHEGRVAVFKAIVSYCVQSDAAPRMRSATRTVTEIERNGF
jgi:hypothetical protein